MKRIKEKLYFLKQWYLDVFTYPKQVINIDSEHNYDAYWHERRGSNVGVLSSWQKNRADIILQSIMNEGEISIGDIGCGEGTILRYLMDNHPLSLAIGYDSSPFVLEKAEAVGIQTEELDIADKKSLEKLKEVDYYLILETLEHIPHAEYTLREAYKKSRKGVFFSFPNTGYFIYRLRLMLGRVPKQWINLPNEHVRFWTYKDLEWWMAAQGYTRYTIHTYKGVRVLNKIWPSLFAAAFVVHLQKE